MAHIDHISPLIVYVRVNDEMERGPVSAAFILLLAFVIVPLPFHVLCRAVLPSLVVCAIAPQFASRGVGNEPKEI